MPVMRLTVNREPTQSYVIKSVTDKSDNEKLIVFENDNDSLKFRDLLMSSRVIKDGVSDNTTMEVIGTDESGVTLRMVEGSVKSCREIFPGETFFKVGSFVEEKEKHEHKDNTQK